MNDLEPGLLTAITAFAHARLESLLQDIAADGETLLRSHLPQPSSPSELAQYQTKAAEVAGHLQLAGQHLTDLRNRLASPPTTLAGARAAVDELGAALSEVVLAIVIIAGVVPAVGEARTC